MQEFGKGCTQYMVCGCNNVQTAPLIQLPVQASTRRTVAETMKFMAGLEAFGCDL